jgi:hypothetical protein
MIGGLLKEVKFMWNFLWQDKKRWPFRWLLNRGNSMGRFDCISEREHVATMTLTQTPLKTRGELRCSGRVSSSCSTRGTHRVHLITSPGISHEWGKDWEVFTTSGTYPWLFVTQIFHNGQPSHGGNMFSLWYTVKPTHAGASSGAGTAHPSGAPEFTPGF